MRAFLVAASLMGALALLPQPLAAWGAEGHHIVARIALSYLTPAARTEAAALLGAADFETTFVAVSTWADEVRSQRPETYNWHFVDIPYTAAAYDPARDCKPSDRGDCIIAELDRARHEMGDHSLSLERRQEALKFLIHFVGDLHQPLHCIDDHDRGGNDVHVVLADQPPGRGTPNLHGVWDSSLIGARGLDEAAYTGVLLADLRARPVTGPVAIVAWAEESHQVALDAAYAFDGASPSGPPPTAVILTAAYQAKAKTVIDLQLERGGARLAALLNEIAASSVPDGAGRPH